MIPVKISQFGIDFAVPFLDPASYVVSGYAFTLAYLSFAFIRVSWLDVTGFRDGYRQQRTNALSDRRRAIESIYVEVTGVKEFPEDTTEALALEQLRGQWPREAIPFDRFEERVSLKQFSNPLSACVFVFFDLVVPTLAVLVAAVSIARWFIVFQDGSP
jgi:hypothetical protein